jgi:hypothetical protein
MRTQPRFVVVALGTVMAVMLLAKGGTARADIVTSVSLSGTAPLPIVGDVLTLNPGSIASLTLPFGVPVTTDTQTLSFFVGDSGPTNQLFPFTLTQNVTIGGVTHPITLSGELLITPPGDTLTLFPGPTTEFDLGSLGVVVFTPLGAGPVFNGAIGTTTDVQLQGTFVAFAAVPEPSSLALLGLGVAALTGWRLRRKQSSR